MNFEWDDEQLALRDAVRDLLEKHCSGEQVRTVTESPEGHDPALWRRMAKELGLTGIALPEEHGGSGAGLDELGVVLGELGRAVAPGPFFSTVALAAPALLRSGDADAQAEWLPRIAEGDVTATLAVAEPATTAVRDGEHWRLTGAKELVTDGADVDLLLVLAGTADGPTLFAVTADAPGLGRTGPEAFDLTRRLAAVPLADTPGTPVGGMGAGLDIVRGALDTAAVLLACEQVGGAERVLAAATGYAGTRVQFERPIGSFQAIKHLLADVLLDVQSARGGGGPRLLGG